MAEFVMKDIVEKEGVASQFYIQEQAGARRDFHRRQICRADETQRLQGIRLHHRHG